MDPKWAVLFLLTTLLALCSGLPANLKEDVEPVPPSKTYGDQPIVDTGIFGGGWENPFKSDAFGGLFDNLEGIMERMRQQISALISSFPSLGNSSSTEDMSPFPSGFENPVFPILPGIDLSKGNTSSITKVIDGHTVVINETEYKNEDDFGGTFFKVRIIDVKPDSEVVTTEKEAEAVPENSTSKDREEIANSMENEIFKSKEADVTDGSEQQFNETEKSSEDQYANLETFDEDANSLDINNGSSTLVSNETGSTIPEHTTGNTEWDEDRNDNPEWSFADSVEPVESNSLDVKEFAENERRTPFDLSGDTYVNELLAERGGSTNPDAEILVFDDDKLSPFGGRVLPLDTRK